MLLGALENCSVELGLLPCAFGDLSLSAQCGVAPWCVSVPKQFCPSTQQNFKLLGYRYMNLVKLS